MRAELDYNRLTVAAAEKAKKDATLSTGHLKADIAFLREKLAALEEAVKAGGLLITSTRPPFNLILLLRGGY